MAWHRAQRPRPSVEGPKPEPVSDWRAFAGAFLRLKADRDHLARRVAELEGQRALDEIKLAAQRSWIASLAEDNGDGGW